jgi:GTP-binding protein Era
MKRKYNLSIVGQSNTGKSSLINYLSNMKITTESHRLQTTRINLHHIISLNGLEINIIDTPGISLVNNDLLSESMKNAYIKTLSSIDLVLIILDINNKDLKYEESIMNLLESDNKNILIVINKIDLADDDLNVLQNLKEKLNSLFDNELFFISIKSKQGLNQLFNRVTDILQREPPICKDLIIPFKNRIYTMQEIIRGVIVNLTHNELPYDTAVLIDKSEEKRKLISLYATIFTSKENQKKIIIGKSGSMIKKIGIESRSILEENYNKKFFISLNVLVKDNWKNNYSLLKKIGYID